MSTRRLPDLPLFPLGLVALPSEMIPLHIFEDRYLKMIEACMDSHGEFGILWFSEEKLKEVGCACAVDSVTEQLSDGHMNIVVRGTRPFRLIERKEDLPYPSGTVEFLADAEEAVDEQAADDARGLYADLVEQATDRIIEQPELEAMSSYRMAATVDFGVDAKQQLLELRSESSRLRLLVLLLRAAVKRLEFVERAQARARSNGKVRFG